MAPITPRAFLQKTTLWAAGTPPLPAQSPLMPSAAACLGDPGLAALKVSALVFQP